MASNEIEIEQSTTTDQLKHLWLLKKIVVHFLVVFSNAYNYAKENSSDDFKTTVVFVENIVVSTFGPLYQKLKESAEQINVFVDDEFDKYAPSLVKNLVDELESLIYKNKSLVKELLTPIQAFITPPITTTIFLLQTIIFLLKIINYLIQNITSSCTTTTPAQTPLQSTTSPDDTMKSILQHSLDAAKSIAPDTILQTGTDLVNQAQDTTNSLTGGIPLVSNAAQSIVPNPIDLASQIANTTNTLVNENPVLEAVNSVAQESLDTATSLTPDAVLQKGTDLVNQAQDTATSLTGGIPLVSNAAQSILTNTTNLANQVANTTNSLVSENPILEAANSATQNIGNKPQATGTKAALQSAYMTLKLAMIPVIAQLWYEVVNKYPTVADLSEFILPVVECVCTLYNKVVTYMDEKGYSIFGYLPLVPVDEIKAAYKLVKTSSDALSSVGDLLGTQNNKGLSAVEDLLGMNKSNNTTSNLANQAQDTTESLVGGIPLVGDAAQSILTNTTNLANQAVNATNSLVNENPILEAANSATQNIGNKPQATGTKAALQSAYKTLKLAMIPVIAQLWYAIVNKYPLVDDLSGFILPVIECMCKLYNKMVTYMDGKGYSVFGYLPLVPVDEIEAAYKLLKTSSDGLSAIGDLLGTHNNEGLSAVGDLLGMKKNN